MERKLMARNGGGCQLAIVYQPIGLLKPNPDNLRKHPKKQIEQIARSLEIFGFNVPILVNADLKVIAGHGRLLAARQLGLSEVPTISVEHLMPEEAKAFAIADNRLSELSSWDDDLLGEQLRELSTRELDFSLEVTGFDLGQIELLIGDVSPRPDPADKLPRAPLGPPVSRPGDLWHLGPHRIYCGNADDEKAYHVLMGQDHAAAVFCDPPCDLRMERELAAASGYAAVIADTLAQICQLLARYSCDGSFHYLCTDWRYLRAVMDGALRVYSELKDLCVWAKDKAGTGSLYLSQHEIVLVLQHGRNRQSESGSYKGRRRSNLWRYPVPRHLRADDPRKPVRLIADALLDSSAPGEIVLDAFLGSGTALIAAEQTKRLYRGLARDPHSVDTAIRRWQAFTGKSAHHAATGRTFDIAAH
jgi:hypothetical protein